MHLITSKTRQYLEDGLLLMENPQRAIATGRLSWRRALETVRIIETTLFHRDADKQPRNRGKQKEMMDRLENRKRPAYVLDLFDETVDVLLPLLDYATSLEEHLSALDRAYDDSRFATSLETMTKEIRKSLERVAVSEESLREKILTLTRAGRQGGFDLQNDDNHPSTEMRYFLTFLREHPVWGKLVPTPEEVLACLRTVLNE